MSVISVLVWTLLAPVVLVLWLVGAHGPITWLLTLAFVILGFPWAVARTLTIPAGWVRPSWVVGWLAEVVWRSDRLGGAALAAAWALGMRRKPHAKLGAWVDRRVEALEPLGGAGVVAAGLAAAARGDDAGARRLLESLTLLRERGPAVRLAAEWLCAEAAARGDWEAVTDRSTPTTRFLSLAAARLRGEPVPERDLRLAWLLAPRRRAMRPLLLRALATRPAPLPTRGEQGPAVPTAHPYREGHPPPDTRLRAALSDHIALLRTGTASADRIAAAAKGWDDTLSDAATRGHAAERARIVGGRAETTLTALAAAIEEDLATLALASGSPLPDTSTGVAAGAARRMRQTLLAGVEEAARALSTRVSAKRKLPAAHEWREALNVLALVHRAGRLGGLALRRLVFEDVHGALCPLACHLWNDRGQKTLGDALFRELLTEAEAVGNARLAEHERRNVRMT